VDELVLHGGRIFVPATSALWPDILATAHGAGHEGVQKTLHRLRASFYNLQAAHMVRDYIKGAQSASATSPNTSTLPASFSPCR
jgi:hypothetical protein